jgi:hypothetical protein
LAAGTAHIFPLAAGPAHTFPLAACTAHVHMAPCSESCTAKNHKGKSAVCHRP